MDHTSLVREEIDEAERLTREFDKIRPVKAAFWMRAGEEDRRYFYIASDEIDDSNYGLAYREIGDAYRKLGLQWLDLLQIKVLYGTDPLAIAADELLTKYPAKVPTRMSETNFARRYVDELYLYPSLHTASGRS